MIRHIDTDDLVLFFYGLESPCSFRKRSLITQTCTNPDWCRNPCSILIAFCDTVNGASLPGDIETS
ncbi:MAG: hypothetical protein IJL64_05305, partial [Bacteroidales bacterium]|nr:hypothetical protein [Bacteroidales bacterium]